MIKLSLKLPKKHQDDFFKDWILFFVGFLENPSKDEVDQIIFNLWDRLPNDTEKLFSKLLNEGKLEDCGDSWILGKKHVVERESYNFNTVPVSVDSNGLKDLWDIGDSLTPIVAIKDIPKVLEELCNARSETMYFSTTSLAQNYIIRIYGTGLANDYFYTRFFK